MSSLEDQKEKSFTEKYPLASISIVTSVIVILTTLSIFVLGLAGLLFSYFNIILIPIAFICAILALFIGKDEGKRVAGLKALCAAILSTAVYAIAMTLISTAFKGM